MPESITRELLEATMTQHAVLQAKIRASKDPDGTRIDEWCADRINLLVELGEFCNEWQGFKYWKKHRAPAWGRLLEEYVDVLSVLFSIGNNMNAIDEFDPLITIAPRAEYDRELLSVIYHTFQVFEFIVNKRDWYIALRRWLWIGTSVGFKMTDIFKAYNTKYAENLRRQETGY